MQNYIDACALFKTNVVKEIGYDESVRVFEDWDLYLTLAEQGVTGVLLDEPLLLYRKHANSDSMLNNMAIRKKVATSHYLRQKHRKLYSVKSNILHNIWYPLYKLGIAKLKVRELAG